ncbi:unnamed protein product [Paramecium octaurelia]|uniref:Uncharacterized protein n=1 Tax=Paramecium octaurelia TaxID=43137 RepID=A0A8S1X2W6_PAROT|nr:unnamed protein product [Paramecium octaurelia]
MWKSATFKDLIKPGKSLTFMISCLQNFLGYLCQPNNN